MGKKTNVPIYVTSAKPIGAWAGHTENCVETKKLIIFKNFLMTMIFKQDLHVNGVDLGCIAVKRSITVTRYGDVAMSLHTCPNG